MERKWYLDLWALIREPFKRGIPEIVEFGTIQRGLHVPWVWVLLVCL